MSIILSEILKDFKHRSEIQLRWKDIDQFGHVNNSNYLTFFEVARFNYCKEVCDWDWSKDKFIIANIHIEYLRPIFFPNKTYVYLRVSKLGEKSFEFEYIVTTEKNGIEKLASKSTSTQVMYDLESQKTILVPDHIRAQFKEYEQHLS